MKKLFIHFLHKIPSAKVFRYCFKKLNPSNKGFIITLHRVTKSGEQPPGLNSFIEITREKLETVITGLKQLGCKFIPLEELERSVYHDVKERPVVHISFDDGYADNYELAFPVFKKHHICFSIFIVSDFIGNQRPFLWWYLLENIINNNIEVSLEKYNFKIDRHMYASTPREQIFERFRTLVLENADKDTAYFKDKLFEYAHTGSLNLPAMLSWAQIREMIDSGLCEIGVHTKTHPRFTNLQKDERLEEISACRQEIKAQTGLDSAWFAYPYGSATDIGATRSIPELMQAAGIRLAFTTQSALLDKSCNRLFLPREFINNSATMYTLKTRLTGAYQNSLSSTS